MRITPLTPMIKSKVVAFVLKSMTQNNLKCKRLVASVVVEFIHGTTDRVMMKKAFHFKPFRLVLTLATHNGLKIQEAGVLTAVITP